MWFLLQVSPKRKWREREVVSGDEDDETVERESFHWDFSLSFSSGFFVDKEVEAVEKTDIWDDEGW